MIQLTWAFRSASFYDIFPGALLSLLRQNPDRPFSPSRNTFNDFIRLWFDHMYGTITTNRFRYAYVITLLGFLNVRIFNNNWLNNFIAFKSLYSGMKSLKKNQILRKIHQKTFIWHTDCPTLGWAFCTLLIRHQSHCNSRRTGHFCWSSCATFWYFLWLDKWPGTEFSLHS